MNAVHTLSIAILLAAGVAAGIAPTAFAQPIAPTATANLPGAGTLSAEQAALRYRHGEALERKRDWQGALGAYLEAGESGHGLAQKKLGDIYGTGNPAVERDYENALRWYHKAREQGIEIPKPFSYPGMPILGAPK